MWKLHRLQRPAESAARLCTLEPGQHFIHNRHSCVLVQIYRRVLRARFDRPECRRLSTELRWNALRIMCAWLRACRQRERSNLPSLLIVNHEELDCCRSHGCCCCRCREGSAHVGKCNRARYGTSGCCPGCWPQRVAADPHCRIVCPGHLAGRRVAQRAVSAHVQGPHASTR